MSFKKAVPPEHRIGSQVVDLYHQIDSDTLKVLRRAFELDLASGADEEFCNRRISMIDVILLRRAGQAPGLI